MTPERWERVEALFEEALQRPVGDRSAFLDETCAGDEDLRRAVAGLLDADGGGGETFLADAVAGGIDLWAESQVARRRIGPYRLIRRIGYGGMGVVYLAERADREYDQRVAVKVVRPGLDSGPILERFRSERQILAGLEHPNIARLLDGGTTADGRPYLVMEYIEGQPIDRYCDEQRLGVEARLELFRSVCEAVQYAHQHLVVHRDLKPSNILVTGEATVKLLDFGIARILSPGEAAAGFEPSATADRPLTLSHASPEQIRGERVTLASDVYSLGVVLFELLVGRPPLDVGDVAPQEAVRRILEEDAPAPSTLASSERLARRLRGDLDAVVLTALRKQRSRRYGSAARLCDDVGRHLAGRPVTARADSFGYRASKFVRRNRWPLAVAAAFVAVVAAAWVSRAEQAARIEEERDKARQVKEFLIDVFEISDPGQSRGESVTARELLDAGAARLDQELHDQPRVRATMLDTLSNVYYRLGLLERARGLAEEALAIRRQERGGTRLELAESLRNLGAVLEAEGDYTGAERDLREALEIHTLHPGEESGEAARVKNDLALILQVQGRYDEAEPYFREALETCLDLYGESHEVVASATSNLALLLGARGEYEEAQRLTRRALELSREFYGEPHAEVARQLNNLGHLRAAMGAYDEAEALHRQALAMRRELFGSDHQDLQESTNNLAIVLFRKGDYDSAEGLFREALESARRLLGQDHPEVTATANNLSAVLNKKGDFEGAAKMSREVLRLRRLQLPEEHPEVAKSLDNLAALYFSLEQYDEAAPLYEEALGLRRRVLGEEHPDVAQTLSNLARLHQRLGDPDEALRLQERALAIQQKSLGEEHPKVARSLAVLASIRSAAGRRGEAKALYRRALDEQRRLLQEDHPDLAISLTGLGELLLDMGEVQEAEAALAEAFSIRESVLGAEHWQTAETRSALGACFAAQGHTREAEQMLTEGLRVLEEKRGAGHPLTEKARSRLESLRQSPRIPYPEGVREQSPG